MKRLYILILIIWGFIGYGFTSPEVDSFPSVHRQDTTIVNVSVKMPDVSVVVSNDNSPVVFAMQEYMNKQDSMLHQYYDSLFDYILTYNEDTTPQTYMGYLTHSTEYSEGQINRFINAFWFSGALRAFGIDLGLLAVSILFIILIAKETDHKVNPTPTFILMERIAFVIAVLIGIYGMFDMLSLFFIGSDAFRFEYLINLLE